MSFSFSEDSDEVMSEINMTPLVDVMLVLLIIFIITAPVMKYAVQVELPQASSKVVDTPPAVVGLSINAQGQYLVNQVLTPDEGLRERLAQDASKTPQPQLQIYGDRAVPYERVAQAMATAQQVGWRNLAFVTEQVKPSTP